MYDLKLAGFALQTRWLWLQKTDSSCAWSELPINIGPEVQAFFRASTYTVIGNGRNTKFWDDRWIEGAAPSDIAPTLVRLVPSRVRKRLTVHQGLTTPNQPTLGYTQVQSRSEAMLSSGRLGRHFELKSYYGSHSGGVTGLMFTGQGMDSRREKSVTSATRRQRQLITFYAAAPSHESFSSASARL